MLHRLAGAALALIALAACETVPTDERFGGRSAEVRLLTREQLELETPDSPPSSLRGAPIVQEDQQDQQDSAALQQRLRQLAATAYVVDDERWLELDLERRFQELRSSERRGQRERAQQLRDELLGMLEPYRVTKGRTPVTERVPQQMHVFVAERDGALERVAFNPLQEREVVVELRPAP